MNEEKVMYFLRNIEFLKKEDVESQSTEYEVITNAHIVGEWDFGPYRFGIWEFESKQEGEERKLFLKITDTREPEYGFYISRLIAEEIIFLASLFLHRSLQLGPIIRIDDTPYYSRESHRRARAWLDKSLVSGKSNLDELNKSIVLIQGLKKEYHQRFRLAVRLYHQALSLIETQPDIAYLNLISAIETLSQDFDIGDVSISDINIKLARLLESIKESELRIQIIQSILKSEKFIRRRFREFILNHIESSFWLRKKPDTGAIKREDLPRILNNIYDQRSKTLHDGDPFPPWVYQDPTRYEWEIPTALSISFGEKKWLPKEFIPYPHFFEKLVNHVLITYLKRNQIN